MTKHFVIGIAAAAIAASVSYTASAKDVTVSVWAGGTGPNETFRVDNIEVAAGLLEQARGEHGLTRAGRLGQRDDVVLVGRSDDDDRRRTV